MRLSAVALGLAAGLLWGAAILVVGLANQIWPHYGEAFLEVAASIYPGYRPGGGIGSIIIGVLYGFVDGAIGGALFGWLYNALSGNPVK